MKNLSPRDTLAIIAAICGAILSNHYLGSPELSWLTTVVIWAIGALPFAGVTYVATAHWQSPNR